MATKTKKMVYSFGGKVADGGAKMKALLGGKGANLAEMVKLGIPVPPGFTITTKVCDLYFKNKEKLPKGIDGQVDKALEKINKITKRTN